MAQFEHPETGKVLNPSTGHWVQKSYAKGRGFLKEARLHTAEHFKKQEKEAKKEKKMLNEQEREDVSKEQLDETARVTFDTDDTDVDGLIADIEHREQLDDDFNADDFFNVSMPEMGDTVGFDPRMKDGNFPGIYSTNNSNQPTQPTRREHVRGRKRKKQDVQKRYVRTETGGMKIVRPGDEEWSG